MQFLTMSFTNACILILMCFNLNAQYYDEKIVDSLKNVIANYRANDSYRDYYYYQDDLEMYFVNNLRSDSLRSMFRYYNYLPKTAKDSAVYREYLMRHSTKLKNYLNDYDAALHCLLSAHVFASDNQNFDDYVWNIEKVIGGIYARLNDYDKAIYFYKLCIPALTKGLEDSRLARLYRDIGDAYLWSNRGQEMILYYNKAIELAKKVENYESLQSTTFSFARFYFNQSEYPERLQLCNKYLRQSFNYLHKLSDDKSFEERKSELLVLEGDLLTDTGDYEKAFRKYEKALVAFAKTEKSERSREIAKIHLSFAKTYFKLQQLEKCNSEILKGISKLIPNFNNQELPKRFQIENENTFTELLQLKSKYYFNRFESNQNFNYLDSALLSLDLAMLANSQLGDKLVLNKSKFIHAGWNKKLVIQGIEICYAAIKAEGGQKFIDKSRAYFDESKSMILTQNLSENEVRKDMILEDQNSLQKIEEELIRLTVSYGAENNIDSIEKEFLLLHEQKIDLVDNYSNGNINYTPISSPYLEYVEGNNEYFLFTNMGGNKLLKIENKSEIDSIISRITEKISDTEFEFNSEGLKIISRKLLPIALDSDKDLVIIPDGKLAYFPFDLLVINDQYLFEDKNITVQLHHKQNVQKGKLLDKLNMYCLGPRYKAINAVPCDKLERGMLNSLMYAETEISKVASSLEAIVRIDSTVGKFELGNLIRSNDIFHYAGHAIVKEDSAYLALIENDGNYFNLLDDQIYFMNNQLQLVTLSACETGLGTFIQGEGVRSLASSFLNSGSKAIVYSLWNANDESTSVIMTSFYKYLGEGKKKDESLALAKRNYLKTASPGHRHPYYWAGFVLVGDTSNIVSSSSIYDTCIPVSLILLSIVLFLFLFRNKTKHKENEILIN